MTKLLISALLFLNIDIYRNLSGFVSFMHDCILIIMLCINGKIKLCRYALTYIRSNQDY